MGYAISSLTSKSCNHSIYRHALIKCQILFLNLNWICQKPGGMVLKSQQLIISLKLIPENVDMLFKAQSDRRHPQYFISTEVDINTPWRQLSLGTHMVHQQRHMLSGKNKLERDFQISKHHLISQREIIN